MSEVGRVRRVQGGVRIAGNHLGTSYRVRMCEAAAANQVFGIASARIVQSGTTIRRSAGSKRATASSTSNRTKQLSNRRCSTDAAGITERIGRIDWEIGVPRPIVQRYDLFKWHGAERGKGQVDAEPNRDPSP